MLSVKHAIQDILNNRFLNLITIVTIALSIFIVSAFALFFINVNEVMNAWKKGVRIMVYLKPDLGGLSPSEIKRKLLGMYGVKSARYISKKDALSMLQESMQRQLSIFENLKENPLPDAFEILVLPSAADVEKIENLACNIEALEMVDDVEYGQQWFDRFANIFNLFRLAGYAVGGLFFIAAVFIVANTIRLVLYSRRDEIEIMRLVGATDRFIKTPFYLEGIIQGALGGLIGLIILYVAFKLISANLFCGFTSSLFSIRFLSVEVLCSVLVCSMIMGWLGCFLSIKQFFKVW